MELHPRPIWFPISGPAEGRKEGVAGKPLVKQQGGCLPYRAWGWSWGTGARCMAARECQDPLALLPSVPSMRGTGGQHAILRPSCQATVSHRLAAAPGVLPPPLQASAFIQEPGHGQGVKRSGQGMLLTARREASVGSARGWPSPRRAIGHKGQRQSRGPSPAQGTGRGQSLHLGVPGALVRCTPHITATSGLSPTHRRGSDPLSAPRLALALTGHDALPEPCQVPTRALMPGHSFSKYLPSESWVPGPVLGPGGSGGRTREGARPGGRAVSN